jgi:glycosyltransferase involved in cell wall biosynthesis
VPAESSPPSLTAIVITRNEAHRIAACIAALRFAPHVLVIDSESQDGTGAAAAAVGAQVMVHPFTDYASQRNFGIAHARTEWLLMIDADEIVSPALGAEIVDAIERVKNRPEVGGFRLLRRNHFMGRPLTRSRSGNERLVRLMRAARAKYVNAVHETPVIDGEIRELDAPMEHLTNARLSDAFDKSRSYAMLWAQDMHGRGRTTSLLGIAGHTLHRWIKVYVLKGGFLEGTRGFILAGFESVGVFFKYSMLWERQRRDRQS